MQYSIAFLAAIAIAIAIVLMAIANALVTTIRGVGTGEVGEAGEAVASPEIRG